MILSFKVENFRSIKESLEIKLTTEKRLKEKDLSENTFEQNGHEFVKSLLLYGRNASGKSNVLNALTALRILVISSNYFRHEDLIQYYEPFLFDENYKNKPVKFELNFISNQIKYRYTILFIQKEIIYESLYFYPSKVKAKLFERKKNKITYGDYYKGTKKRIEDDLLQNQLFLSKSASSNVKYLNECYLYFFSSFSVFTIHDTAVDNMLIAAVAEDLLKYNIYKQNLLELLKAGDTSIQDFKIKKYDKDKYEILTKHNVYKNGKEVSHTHLDFENESLGTKKLFLLGSIVLATLNIGGIAIIDELDKGLHPLLSKMLIKLFNSKKNNPNNAQLLFATHDSTLLDLEDIRRDQVCFIDKEFEGNSICYKLSDIKGVRKDIPIDKWYLSGRFSAIPVITEPNLNFKSND